MSLGEAKVKTNIKCLKCHAGSGNLYVTSELTEFGRVKVISCRVCGNRVENNKTTIAEVPRPPKVHKMVTQPCSACGDNSVRTGVNKTGLCKPCGMKKRVWDRGAKSTPPPFVEVLGRWIINPDWAERAKVIAYTRKKRRQGGIDDSFK